MVYDSRAGEQPPVMATNVSFSPTQRYQSAGLWVQADTLDGLAHEIDVPADNLADTVAASTSSPSAATTRTSAADANPSTGRSPAASRPWCRSTRRPTARRRSGCPTSAPRAVCAPTSTVAFSTPTGRPIPGLYAAGNTMAAVSGETYPGGGNPIGASLLFSHRAALHMART